MSADVVVDVNDGVAVLTLNRPDHLNAYTAEMGALLSRAYRECDEDDDVRAIVVTGAGRAFCAGADFSDGATPFDAPGDGAFSASPITPAAFELRKPVIAALKAQLSTLGVAADILLTGRTFAGTEAVALGIASRALPAGQVLDNALEVARDIAVNVAPMSAALSKRLLWDSAIHHYTPRQVASLETRLHHRVMGGADAREGVAAFLDRRPPRFTSRVSRDWTALPEP